MPRIGTLLLLLALTFTIIPSSRAQNSTGRRVGAVAIHAFVFSVEDARADALRAELNSVLSSSQTTPAAAYLAVRRMVEGRVLRKEAVREWEPEGLVAPGEPMTLKTISLPRPPLTKDESKKKRTQVYNVNGTSRGRQLVVSPTIEEATGRANKLRLRYSITSLPNSAAFVGDPNQPKPEPTVIADLIAEKTVELPSSGGTVLSFKKPEEPGRTTVFVIFGVSQ